MVADLLTLAGIRGPSERPHSPATDATGSNITTDSTLRRREGMHRRGKAQSRGRRGTEEAIDVDGKGGGGDNSSGDESEVGEVSTVHGDAAATPLRNNKALGTTCGAKQVLNEEGWYRREGRASAAGVCVQSGAQDGVGVESFDQAARPTTTKGTERGRPTSRSKSRQRHTGGNGGDGGISGSGDRAAPAWEGSFRAGDGGAPSTEEVSYRCLSYFVKSAVVACRCRHKLVPNNIP